MKLKFFRPLAAAGVLVAAALGGTAHARGDVFWSVGIDAAPGVSIGVGNTRPVVVAPAPVYVAPAPVYVAPRPVYLAPRPVYLAPAPVYVQPAPVYVQYGHPGKRKGWYKNHHRHHHH